MIQWGVMEGVSAAHGQLWRENYVIMIINIDSYFAALTLRAFYSVSDVLINSSLMNSFM